MAKRIHFKKPMKLYRTDNGYNIVFQKNVLAKIIHLWTKARIAKSKIRVNFTEFSLFYILLMDAILMSDIIMI